jgi:hypothetical protein
MKVLFIGDPHIDDQTPASRSDNYGDTVLLKLKWCFEYALNSKINEVWLSGDTFERNINSIPYRMRVKALFREYKDSLNIRSAIGNHSGDTIYSKYETYKERQLGEFFADNLIHPLTVIRTLNDYGDILALNAYQYTPQTLPDLLDVTGIVAHAFLDTPDPKLSFKVKDLKAKYPKLEFIMAGHDHQMFPHMKVWGVDLIRPGSLMRTSNDVTSYRIPHVAVYDTDTKVTDYVPIPMALPPEQVFINVSKDIKKGVAEKARTFTEALASIDTEKRGVVGMLQELAQQVPEGDRQLIMHDLAENGFKA